MLTFFCALIGIRQSYNPRWQSFPDLLWAPTLNYTKPFVADTVSRQRLGQKAVARRGKGLALAADRVEGSLAV